ncbi:MAG TPA: AAA family ATPase [Jiangellaceae bacterium]|nr:AAA family ATPase [Jiangellaceae bacterium]
MTVSSVAAGLGWPELGRPALGSTVEPGPGDIVGDGLGWPEDLAGGDARSEHGVAGRARAEVRSTSTDATVRARATAPAQIATAADIVTNGLREAGDLADADTPIAHQAAAAVFVTTRRRERFPAPASTRIMVVANQKGGVGKTTTAVNIAAAMAFNGLRVLVIDLDPQGNASTALGIDHHADIPSSYDVLVEERPVADVIVAVDGIEGLSCMPATIDLAGAEIELVSLVARESRLRKALTAHLASLPENASYDYVLIDCPPSLGLLTVNALVGGDEVFIPIQCEYYALEGLSQLLKNIDLVRAHLNPELAVTTILLTMYDGRTRLAAQVAEEVRHHFGETVLRTTIPRSVRISEAPSYGQTVMTYDAGSSGALSYLEAAREMAERGATLPTDSTGHSTKENP